MRTDLKVPFAEKEEAKNLGAKWDPKNKTWYVENCSPMSSFAKWLPLSLSLKPSDAFRSEAQAKAGESGHATFGNTQSPRPNTCNCTLWGECEQCRSRRNLS